MGSGHRRRDHGRRKFGPQSGEWPDDGWQGWWGDTPPIRTPVFVLTHHQRDPIEFPNGTTFHFTDDPIDRVLQRAKDAAGGLDVRLGGGPSTVRQFLQADLIDFLHLTVVPITLGRGVRLLDEESAVEGRFAIESVSTASGLTHQLWNRQPRG